MTETTPALDIAAVIDTYLAAWNEPDPDRRVTLVESVWAEDGQLVDPPMSGEGHNGINDLMSALHAQFPGHAFRRTSGVDTHNGRMRFAWELVGPDGTVSLEGLDVGEIGADGRLARVTGFFGPLPTV